MKNCKLKNIMLINMFVLLFSCGGYNEKKDFLLKDDKVSNDESIVIIGIGKTKFTHTASFITPPIQGIGQMEWCNVETKKCFFINPYDSRVGIQMLQAFLFGPLIGLLFSQEVGIYSPSESKYIVLKIKPGIYFLKTLNLTLNDVSVDGAFNKRTNKPSLAIFEVKSNEILYLGDINVNVCYFIYKSNTARFVIEDNFDNILLYTSSKFPHIKSEQIDRRLIIVGENANEDKCQYDQ